LSGKLPATRTDYWHPKLERNVARDAEAREGLKTTGWDVLVIWECETNDLQMLGKRLADFLGS
jgi:DNA mismatch endonuclease (patch repair protein)